MTIEDTVEERDNPEVGLDQSMVEENHKGGLYEEQVRGTTRCVTISMKYYALTGLERFDWY